MRLLLRQSAARPVKARLAGPLAVALVGLMLGPSGPALGEHAAPAVLVPPAVDDAVFGSTGAGVPIVLVPLARGAALPDPGQAAKAWAPAYLAPYGLTPPNRVAAGAPRREADTAKAAGGQSFTLSDVLRAAEWRRETAARLRSETTVQPLD